MRPTSWPPCLSRHGVDYPDWVFSLDSGFLPKSQKHACLRLTGDSELPKDVGVCVSGGLSPYIMNFTGILNQYKQQKLKNINMSHLETLKTITHPLFRSFFRLLVTVIPPQLVPFYQVLQKNNVVCHVCHVFTSLHSMQAGNGGWKGSSSLLKHCLFQKVNMKGGRGGGEFISFQSGAIFLS